MSRLTTTVIVTSFHDRRIETTLDSLAEQTHRPDEILIADGSVDEAFRAWLAALAERHHARIVHEDRASIARARNLALDEAHGEVLVFLDTDQRAPPDWLSTLVAPLEAGEVDWVGGPTRPTASLAIMDLKERRLYAAAHLEPTRIPMGNSAWKAQVFAKIGRFDERLAMGGEDWDVALRARHEGFQGRLVDEAWVEHDLRGLDSHWKLAKKQYRYNVGGAMAFLKNRDLTKRAGQRFPRVERHWFDLIEPVLKAAALPVAWWKLKRL